MSKSTHFRAIPHQTPSDQCAPNSETQPPSLLIEEEAEVKRGTLDPVTMELESMRMETQMLPSEETAACTSGKTDSPSKKKGKSAESASIIFPEFIPIRKTVSVSPVTDFLNIYKVSE